MSRFISYICIFAFLFWNCNNSNKQQVNKDNTFFINLVEQWNKAHNNKNIEQFRNLYAKEVLFYTELTNNSSCIEKKIQLFKRNPDFYQLLNGSIEVEELEDGTIKCSFVKSVTLKNKTNDYPSYLVFEKDNDEWHIVTEGDLTTDKNIGKKREKLNNLFIKGLKKGQVYLYNQIEKGSKYIYQSKETKTIDIFMNNASGIDFKEGRNYIQAIFKVGYEEEKLDTGDILYFLKKNVKLVVGQYDFDKDKIDELIIALQDNDDLGGISFFIYKLQNNKWITIGENLTADGILGEPIAEIENNRITVERHLRSFYYQWTYEYGSFKDTGDY
ncbi:hypothetical protein [Capnocytophaga sputigena]|jgi:heat shock protein dnaJ domain protein